MTTAYDFDAERIDQTPQPLSAFSGSVSLIVNTASKCGFTPQYEGLQALYEQWHDRGFNVLGFPCNQFGKQEPGDAEEIQAFCTRQFHVSFPLFAKIDVNGEHTHPLYQFLKSEQPGVMGSQSIKWNFTKFLIGKDGAVIKRYGSKTKPADIEADIEALL